MSLLSRRKKKQQRGKKSNDNFRESVLKVNARALTGKPVRLRKAGVGVLLGIAVPVAMLLLYFGLLKATGLLFFENDFFRLRNVEINNSGEIISSELVLNHPMLKNCSNIFEINIREFRDLFIQQHPRVKSMDIRRKLPGVIRISINERTPVARLAMPANPMEVDEEAIVLGGWRGKDDLPFILGHAIHGARQGVNLKGTAVMDALDIIDVCDKAHLSDTIKIRSIDVKNRERIELRLAGGEKVFIAWKGQGGFSKTSRENLETKLRMLAESIIALARKGERIVEIDLTLDDNVPAKTRKI